MSPQTARDTHLARRRLLKAAALTPALTGMAAGAAAAAPAHGGPPGPSAYADAYTGTYAGGGASAGAATGSDADGLARPVPTDQSDWAGVAKAFGRPGNMLGGNLAYHTAFPRNDLRVHSYGVRITPDLALGSHMAFVRYSDDTVLVMGDLLVTEDELQPISDRFQAAGIEQAAIHKHLLAHTPDVWWMHVHGTDQDAEALAHSMRKALDVTGTPGPPPAVRHHIDLDAKAMDAAFGCEGDNVGTVRKYVFRRRETILDGPRVLPPGLGSTSAFVFQPLGGGRAALHGDLVMVADEVQGVLSALRRGGLHLVELHHHNLRDEPRLFFVHVWSVGNATRMAKTLRKAVDLTDVVPTPTHRG
ncbi:DUF1259 domain-containing protein [Streptomyces beihaiensis]|uniref:DUF1259 domain-containing protein n=1 Tax=Streptomyces beihaiensis TaxID=2984495 RepID=A0ABT3TYR1_9ACTN|nr:DUF1259 domain-containing protein [Streptomyces beihaiensis]MCX3061527.1 DUF1259 domain-containing protein [Streptomyces beihaiensis]